MAWSFRGRLDRVLENDTQSKRSDTSRRTGECRAPPVVAGLHFTFGALAVASQFMPAFLHAD